ncbi:uncharacterized protein LOC111372179 [Olea europaea var. sylvestris]|uniref:Uncharacterized protein n=1 Tax=Olea europaea subsp. europaea TaxID=158383 RepID=A0A8S0PKD2_OLEEU|nr:uncharacterized protein LOC111372179 [Olea europaea var. sylvestris]CAA2942574.1 Hypothetical predicted protein [Olea europaea subsp. europaea]
MAACCLPLPPSIKLQRQHQPSSSSSLIYCHLSLQSSNFKPRSLCGRCRATSPGPPSPPPESGPNSKKPPAPSSGVAASFTRFQDTVQIFFAVLFWMSLFFWSSAWGGKDNGRSNKGPRFRK